MSGGRGEHHGPGPGAHVRLLGAVRFVTTGGETVALPSASQRRLLAVLALASGATVRAEQLSDLLDVSTGALRTTVSRLRARLGEETIRTDAVGYRIACGVDATTFTDLLADPREVGDRLAVLEEALSLWDGEALDEFRHEPWAEPEAARLDELRHVAIEDRAELLVERGRAGEAVAALEAHIAAQPLRDRPRGLLMQALAGDGRQADALRAFQDYRTVLAEETGTEPSALVRSIERRVAAGSVGARDDDPGDGARTEPAPPPAFTVPVAGVVTQAPPLIGRRRELTWLESELVQARAGALRVVLVSGEAGAGKTTLLAALARAHGDAGAIALYGRCDEGVAAPLQPFRDVVGAVVDYAPKELLRIHCERFGGELARVAPHLLNRVWAPPPGSNDDTTERYQLFEAVADVLRRTSASSPVILVLEDLHWADTTTLLLLRHLGRALLGARVLVLASFRDTEQPSPELLDALADLERGPARRIALAGFDEAELSQLVASVARSPERPVAAVLEALQVQTAGNPLYTVQLVRHLLETDQLVVDDGVRLADTFAATALPASLLDVVWSRVRALGGGAHAVLQAGAVLGTEFEDDVVAEMIDVGGDDVATALDQAVGAGLLAPVDEPTATRRFTHALVAEALRSELGPAQRRGLHERAARALEAGGEPLAHDIVAALARHWALAGDRAAAQRWATAAGDDARANLAPTEAAAWYETALGHAAAVGRPDAERADLMVRLGEAQQRAGDPSARTTLLDAAGIARRAGANDVLVRAALATDRGHGRVGAVDDELLDLIEAAIEAADPLDPPTYARLLALYALQLIHTPRFELRQETARRAVELIDASDDPTLLPRTIAALTFALAGPGTLALRRDLAVRAVASARLADEPALSFWTHRAAFWVAVESGDPDLARTSLERLASLADDVGEPRLRWVTAVYQAFQAMMEARLADAERLAEAALAIGTEIGEPDAFSLYAGQLFAARSFAGRYAELLPLMEGVVDANPGLLVFRLAHAITCLSVDRRDEARAVLQQGSDDRFARIPVDWTWMTTVIGYAVLAVELEDAAICAELYPILEPYAEEIAFSGVTSQGPISAYLGKLASVTGRHDVADAHLHRALATTRALGWRYHEATTLVALARSRQRRSGALGDDAARWLDEADGIAIECGLHGVKAQVAALRE